MNRVLVFLAITLSGCIKEPPTTYFVDVPAGSCLVELLAGDTIQTASSGSEGVKITVIGPKRARLRPLPPGSTITLVGVKRPSKTGDFTCEETQDGLTRCTCAIPDPD